MYHNAQGIHEYMNRITTTVTTTSLLPLITKINEYFTLLKLYGR